MAQKLAFQTHTHRPGSPPNSRADLPKETSSLPSDNRGRRRKEGGRGAAQVTSFKFTVKALQAFGKRIWSSGKTGRLLCMSSKAGSRDSYTPSLQEPVMAAIMKIYMTDYLT